MTVISLDYALQDKLNDNSITEVVIGRKHSSLCKESQEFFRKSFTMAAENKQKAPQNKEAASKRADRAMKNVKSFATDVCSRLAQHAVIQPLQTVECLLKELLDNNQDNLKRQQEAYLHDVVSQCLLPFYSKLHQLCEFRELVGKGNDSRLKHLDAKKLLKGVRNLITNELSTSENSQRVQRLTAEVLGPKKNECTIAAIEDRWHTMPQYSAKGSRKLGYDLKSTRPEQTLLPDLLIKALARDTVLPLQDELRAMQKDMIDKPANDLRGYIISLMRERLEINVRNAPDLKATLESAWGIAEKGLSDGVREIVDHFHKRFEVRISSLRDSLYARSCTMR